MRKIKYEDHLTTLGLCDCLIPLILFEINQGNKICSYDSNGKWPKEYSHLISLLHAIHLKDSQIPDHENVTVDKNLDMHCNWKTDAYCKVHHHLIIAG